MGLATLKSCDTKKQSVDDNIYIYIYIERERESGGVIM